MGRLPDFLIIGASRCGTSSLFKNLLQHRLINGPLRDKKEIHFFNKSKTYNYGIEWYESQFSDSSKRVLRFEASPAYFHIPISVHRIFKHLPNAKFIVMLRNPVDRVISYYSRWKRKEKQWNPQELKNPQYGIVKTGIYVEALWRWFGYFPRDRFLIIRSESYFQYEKKMIARCFDWLGLESIDIGKPLFYDQKNRQEEWLPYEREVPDDVKDYLREFYKPHNRKLYKLLGKNLGWQ